MDARQEREPNPMNRTNVERKSERELVVTRTFNGPPRIVFEAWTVVACRPRVGSRASRSPTGARRRYGLGDGGASRRRAVHLIPRRLGKLRL
jgi:uncharacterized protein YndB with AHSA1/START domain